MSICRVNIVFMPSINIFYTWWPVLTCYLQGVPIYLPLPPLPVDWMSQGSQIAKVIFWKNRPVTFAPPTQQNWETLDIKQQLYVNVNEFQVYWGRNLSPIFITGVSSASVPLVLEDRTPTAIWKAQFRIPRTYTLYPNDASLLSTLSFKIAPRFSHAFKSVEDPGHSSFPKKSTWLFLKTVCVVNAFMQGARSSGRVHHEANGGCWRPLFTHIYMSWHHSHYDVTPIMTSLPFYQRYTRWY